VNRPALIVNPAARSLARVPRRIDAIRDAAAGRAEIVVPDTVEALDAAARDLIAREVPRVMIVGGDGTVMSALTALDRARGPRPLPPVVLAHAGTVGTVARRLGSPVSVPQAVQGFCAGSLGPARTQPTLRSVDDAGRVRVGFIFGTGLVARFFEKYDAAGGGLPAAASIVARLFTGALLGTPYATGVLSPMPCRVWTDKQRLEPEAWGVIVASVLDDVGLHVRVTYRGGQDPQRPHLVATPIGPRELGFNFPRVVAGLPVRGRGTFDGLVERFRVDFGDAPGPWVFDGDTVRSRTVDVSAGPILQVMQVRRG
jgi:diacylglycerol kinase (ATP)